MTIAWIALVIADVVAVSTLARCFTGPGELIVALSSLLIVHLSALAARQGFLGRQRTWRVFGAVLAFGLPTVIVLGTTVLLPVPGHELIRALGAGWRAFYSELAPVAEVPGLVLATAWAAAAAGWIAEALWARAKVAPALALMPALGLYLFAAAFGTSSWRVVGLATMAASCCWYLAISRGRQVGTNQRLIASADKGVGPQRSGASYRPRALIIGSVVTAAAAAAVVGPNLPGARSAALVEWRGAGASTESTSGLGPGGQSQGVRISTLVQVGEEEVYDPTTALFTVHSSVPTRELVTVLDTFEDGSWSASPVRFSSIPRSFATSISADERRPPAPAPSGPGQVRLVQVFSIAGLGGYDLPTWGNVAAIVGDGLVRGNVQGGPAIAEAPLGPESVYAVASTVAEPSPAQLEDEVSSTADHRYVQLPGDVPQRLVQLAHRLEIGAKTPYEKAVALDAYLTSSRFHYRLPARTSTATVASSGAYGGLMTFLFQSRTGYCQQFATAFAVLARIEGLPTRIAVGFLPGTALGDDKWQVTGIDTHAWPQVFFARYGWIDFEPTPGATIVGSSIPGAPGTHTPSTVAPVATTQPDTHNLHPSPGATVTTPTAPKPARHNNDDWPAVPLLVVIVIAFVVSVASVPIWRRLRLQRYMNEPRSGVLAAWSDTTKMLERAGVGRRGAETFVELAKRVEIAGLLSGDAALALGELARLATAACYAAIPPGHEVVEKAILDAQTVVRSARRSTAWWLQIVAALDPRGLPA